MLIWRYVAYFANEVNSSLAKPPLIFNGGLAKLVLISFIKYTTGNLCYDPQCVLYSVGCRAYAI